MPAMYGSVVRSTYDRTRRILEPVAQPNVANFYRDLPKKSRRSSID